MSSKYLIGSLTGKLSRFLVRSCLEADGIMSKLEVYEVLCFFLPHRPGLSGKIESVNGAMLKSLLEEESDLVVFMYREDNR